MKNGFLRVACATPEVRVADCKFNTSTIKKLIDEAQSKNVSLIVFPELSITAYTCGDLFLQKRLQNEAIDSLLELTDYSKTVEMIIIVGLPICYGANLYNCAAVIYKGEILGIIPKVNIPNYAPYKEMRYFSKGPMHEKIYIKNKEIPFGTDIIFACRNMSELKIGVEICEDLWVPTPPSCYLAASGATLIANLSASDEVLGKSTYREMLVKSQSSKLVCTYLYANAGQGESSTDMVYSGHNLICENGTVLSQSKKFSVGLAIADVDLQMIQTERHRLTTFLTSSTPFSHVVWFDFPIKELNISRNISKYGFFPSKQNELDEYCEQALKIQSNGLKTRLKHINTDKVVIGLSGGQDSTLALLAVLRTFDMMNLNKKNIIGVTMPCFGTTVKTKTNVTNLARALNITLKQIPINKSILNHFEDIGKDPNVHDVTFENAQARERTQVLMDIANIEKALVVGTADMSELALGFSTYNGDHMSMYGLNCSIPKTLVTNILKYEAKKYSSTVKDIILEIISTPISPELLPPHKNETTQKTEDIIGSYELNDFFLYYFLRYNFEPNKILRLANIAFKNDYSQEEIQNRLYVFIDRFFKNQFKRSCSPDGPRITEISLSPRSSFMVPSDCSPTIWIDNIK